MKTTYLSKTSRDRDRHRMIALMVLVAACLLAFFLTGLFSKAFYRTMAVLTFTGDKAGQTASSFGALFSSRASLEQENERLKQEISLLEAGLADREFLIKENSELKSGTYLKGDTGRMSARVLTKPPFAPFDIFLIDIGSAAGVEESDMVMVGSAYLGRVSSVDSSTARVSLVSSPGTRTEVFFGEESIPATLVGKGGGNMEITLPQGTEVNEGDGVFISSGSEKIYVGKVGHIENNEKDTFVSVLVALPINLYQISNVEIISSQ